MNQDHQYIIIFIIIIIVTLLLVYLYIYFFTKINPAPLTPPLSLLNPPLTPFNLTLLNNNPNPQNQLWADGNIITLKSGVTGRYVGLTSVSTTSNLPVQYSILDGSKNPNDPSIFWVVKATAINNNNYFALMNLSNDQYLVDGSSFNINLNSNTLLCKPNTYMVSSFNSPSLFSPQKIYVNSIKYILIINADDGTALGTGIENIPVPGQTGQIGTGGAICSLYSPSSIPNIGFTIDYYKH